MVLEIYHPRMWIGNNFSRAFLSVCVCVCLSVCVSVCLSVPTMTLELLKLGTSFLVYSYILTISRSSLSIKSLGQGPGQMKNLHFFTCYFCMHVCH